MNPQLLGDEQLTGEVIGIHHTDARTGFGVVELEVDGGDGVRLAGPLAALRDGDTVRVAGRWTTHPRHGETFEVTYYEQVAPSTVAGVAAFLEGERFAAVPATARQQVLTTFGAATAAVIEREPARLVEEAGLRQADADTLVTAWQDGRAFADLHRMVAPVGWSAAAVRQVHRRFGSAAAQLAREEPYALLEADRVGFSQVDALARHLGVAEDAPERLAAGALAAVRVARRQDGHEVLERADVVGRAAQLLGVDGVLAADGLAAAIAAGSLVVEELGGEEVVTTSGARRTEMSLATTVARLLAARSSVDARRSADIGDVELTATQQAAVDAALVRGLSILTGGPGTGKTRTVATVVAAAEAAGEQVALCAPTGRAAKRLEEVTGRAAWTIHRLLEARPDGDGGFAFRYGASERLPFDLLIADEVSMCDTWLLERLLAAVDDHTRVVLVGDRDQLPSVGPGDVLGDLVRSGQVPVTSLEDVHRQAAGSAIVRLARGILDGDPGDLPGIDGEVYFAEERDRSRIVPRVVRAVATRAPERFEVSPEDVQVLAPIYRGPAGVDALNAGLKAELNPAAGRPEVRGFNVGDRVLQTRNDPELDLANGDVGTVVDLDRRRGQLRVAFPRGEVTMPPASLGDLDPAWALTVHKAQGGEWPVVVLVVDRSHRGMLWRNLLYTGVTRAQRALIVIGQRTAVRAAAAADRSSLRRTGLVERLERALQERDVPSVSTAAGEVLDQAPPLREHAGEHER